MSQEREPKRIVFVINSLAGGSERALINILNGLETHIRGHEVHLVLLDTLPEVHQVPAYVTKHVLDTGEKVGASIRQLTALMRKLRPAVAISFLTRSNCANVVASRLLGYPAILSERVYTASHFGSGRSAFANKLAVRLFYRFARRILAVSEGVRQGLIDHFGLAGERIGVIHNPISIQRLEERSAEPAPFELPERYAVAVGRLVPNKNFPMLLKAFQRAAIEEHLLIVGEGPDRAALEAMAQSLGIRGRVTFCGYLANPYPVIGSARFLVSTSNAEGFPNAIVEAMALGRPVVATDCNSGPADILSPDQKPSTKDMTLARYGVLVPVERDDILAAALTFFSKEAVLEDYSQAGKVRARSFSAETVLAQYWGEIEHAMSGEPAPSGVRRKWLPSFDQ